MEALYKLRHRGGAEGFAAAWDAAVERGFSRLEDCALERAIAGEERLVVWDGKVVATWKRYDTALLTFLLRQRRPEKYGNLRVAELKPGHPVYEKLRAEWLAENISDGVEARASIMRKLLELKDEQAARIRACESGGEGEVEPDEPESTTERESSTDF